MDSIIRDDVQAVLGRAAQTLAALRSARVFVTGATGFFGMWLLEVLLAANRQLALDCDVVVLSRDPVKFAARAPHLASNPHLTLIEGDVCDFRFPEGPVTHVIHAAADVSPPVLHRNAADAFDVCVDGTRRVLALAEERNTTRLLFVSSGAVYGSQPAGLTRVPEDYVGGGDPLGPATGYAEGKRAAEYLCGRAARRGPTAAGGLAVTVARCFAFVGPHLPLDAHLAIGNFIRDAIDTGAIRVQGDGTPMRSYLYAADLAEWLFAILLRGDSGRAYNVGSEEALSIAEVACRVADVAAAIWPERGRPAVTIARPPNARSAANRYVPDCTRIRRELGLVPSLPFDEAVRRTMTWAAAYPTTSVSREEG